MRSRLKHALDSTVIFDEALLNPWTISLIVTLIAFTAVWAASVRAQDVGLVDYYWGPGFAVSGWLCLALYGSFTLPQLIFMVAVTFWAVRLGLHLVARHKNSVVEDPRYAAMREAGGPQFWWTSLFKIFVLQAIIHWIVQSPVLVVASAESQTTGTLFWIGIGIFALGCAIEIIADQQLASFKRDVDSAGLFEGGLWGLSRHPNYVGEMILWLGLGISAFAISGSWLAFTGPVVLIIVMRGVSIPLTDDHMRSSRSGYDDYAARTPSLLPTGSTPSKVAKQNA